ncbi:hypothetical protein SAMN04488096_101518 [Mesonia phycicola]|uniref:Calx-beta domain-containing protein n=1 Tax=Mesonia phycicola TaxID=579105 RepID=A0A1M6AZ74_9FLAO|nr:DUF4843 domain-containing protein [Mesonia phycicola]SHI41737.1 hypothetical protein SAMN04488096_101518 [Mesonia phycicola]
MKKYNLLKTAVLFFSVFSILSCEDAEETIYEGNTNDQAFIGFSEETYNLEIEIDAEGTLIIPIESSAVRSTDRTFNVNVITESTTAADNTYDLPSTVTIPANEYIGYLEITGFDNDVETDTEFLTIELTGINETEATGFTVAEISVYQVCPVPSDFLIGEYSISDNSATIGPNNDFTNFGPATVTISQGTTNTSRVFSTDVFPGIGTSNEIVLSLVCNSIVFSSEVDTNVYCTEGTNIIFSNATSGGFINSTYDIENNGDDTIEVNYTEDLNGSCGGPFSSSFILTKI